MNKHTKDLFSGDSVCFRHHVYTLNKSKPERVEDCADALVGDVHEDMRDADGAYDFLGRHDCEDVICFELIRE